MTIYAGLMLFAAFAPYLVSGDSAAAAAAAAAAATAASDGDSSSSAAAVAVTSAASDGDSSSSAAAVAVTSAASDGDSSSSAAAAAATSGVSSSPSVRCICELVYRPVCGSDGLTYSNECVLDCISAERIRNCQSGVRKQYDGECRPVSCSCTSVYQPVCGANNHTYTNECWLACTNNRRIQDGLSPIRLDYRRACSRPSCLCADSIIPVCGTDGKTYRNVCIMQCYSRTNVAQGGSPIFIQERKACTNEKCACSNQRDQLCASDETTYMNQCLLDCQNRRRVQLGQSRLNVQYRGECVRCMCTADYNPVCAKNDYTYSNYCQFLCDNEKRRRAGLPELLLRWNGQCNCGCTREYRPICASDGRDIRTFANRCLLRCENRKRYQDGRAQFREVGEGVCQTCDCSYCPNVRRPVCGSDCRTYQNACFLYCNSDCRANIGLSRISLDKDSAC